MATKMAEVRFFKVASFTDRDKTYIVRQLPDGEWKCGCLDFTMNEASRRRQNKSTMCDHIRKARKIKMKRHGKAFKKNKTK